MGQVVTFSQLPASPVADGIASAPIKADVKEMAAELVRIAPGKRWTDIAPRGCDLYLFMLNGAAMIAAAGDERRMPTQAFATVQEGTEFTVNNATTAPADVVKVIAPPLDSGRSLKGFSDGLSVIERGHAPVKVLPQDHKTRLYFVDKEAAHSERAHAMIVIYDKDTLTAMHMHPDAESLFVILDGAIQFTINGKDEVVKPGQAALFGSNDRHSLRAADGVTAASFLEFHIPAGYTTVYG
ncbi:MAG: cupin domain-containing protein [Xanthobacteraceae bacterium]